jgi:hypothetical protein
MAYLASFHRKRLPLAREHVFLEHQLRVNLLEINGKSSPWYVLSIVDSTRSAMMRKLHEAESLCAHTLKSIPCSHEIAGDYGCCLVE